MILVDSIPLPPLLQLPEIPDKCSSGINIQEISRLLGERELKEAIVSRVMASGIIDSKGLPSQEEFFNIVSDIKWHFIKEDLAALAGQIERAYHQKLNELEFNLKYQPSDLLYQIVEIPWTLTEFAPGNSTIRYRVFTKRDICIKGNF